MTSEAINLRCDVFATPDGFRSIADYAWHLGIRWQRFQAHTIAEQVWLLDCDPTTVPDPLPAGITLMGHQDKAD